MHTFEAQISSAMKNVKHPPTTHMMIAALGVLDSLSKDKPIPAKIIPMIGEATHIRGPKLLKLLLSLIHI